MVDQRRIKKYQDGASLLCPTEKELKGTRGSLGQQRTSDEVLIAVRSLSIYADKVSRPSLLWFNRDAVEPNVRQEYFKLFLGRGKGGVVVVTEYIKYGQVGGRNHTFKK